MASFSPEYFAALLLFCFVASVTPGPNNIMLMTSGVNFGFRRTLPHIIGIVIGFPTMVLTVGLAWTGALAATGDELTPALTAMKWVGAAYLLYLAWRTANAGRVEADGTRAGRPLSALEAAAFQWVNPKAWAMALAALTTYGIATDFLGSVIAVTGSFFAVALISATVWVLFGSGLRQFLNDPDRRRWFNWTMAALLVASIIPVFLL